MSDDRRQRGQEIRRSAFGENGEERWRALNEIDAGHAESILEYCFGTIWARPGLDLKLRELIVIAATAAQDLPGEVAIHSRRAQPRCIARGDHRDDCPVRPVHRFPQDESCSGSRQRRDQPMGRSSRLARLTQQNRTLAGCGCVAG